MKQVIESYGTFLLDAVLAVLLFIVLFCGIADAEGNRGIFAILGARLDAAGPENTDYREFEVYQSEAGRKAPVILYRDTGMMYTGTYAISDLIKASGADGEELHVRLLEVAAPDGGGQVLPVPPGTEQVEFANPGVYQLKVTAVDAGNKRTTSLIAVPVNERRM